MNRSHLTPLAAALAWAALAGGRLAAQDPVAHTLRASLDVLEALQAVPERGVPPVLLADAQGVAIIPNVIKAGFVVGGRGGHGVVLTREPDGSWGRPAFVSLGGASVGLQAGVQSTDIVLVFKTRNALDRILKGKGKLTLGADVAVAAGPVGRQAEAATDGRLRAEIYSYSRSRGLFAGVSLEGAAINYDYDANQQFVRTPRPEDLAASDRLRAQLTAMSTVKPPPVPSGAPVYVIPPGPVLNLPPPPPAPPVYPPPVVTPPVVPVPPPPGRF
jgi:lipid-binding SYLF domain-containing protein